jgi:hypothetical protein
VGIQNREERDKDIYALKSEDDKYSLHTYLEIQVLLDTDTRSSKYNFDYYFCYKIWSKCNFMKPPFETNVFMSFSHF